MLGNVSSPGLSPSKRIPASTSDLFSRAIEEIEEIDREQQEADERQYKLRLWRVRQARLMVANTSVVKKQESFLRNRHKPVEDGRSLIGFGNLGDLREFRAIDYIKRMQTRDRENELLAKITSTWSKGSKTDKPVGF